jgi:hypothetical protein
MVARMGPLGKACKKYAADEKQKNVKQICGVPEWPTVVSNNQNRQGLVRSNWTCSKWWILTKAPGLINIAICHQNGLGGQSCIRFLGFTPGWKCWNIWRHT